MHDWLLIDVALNWHQFNLIIELKAMEGRSERITAEGLQVFNLSHKEPWGPSAIINQATLSKLSEQLQLLEIEMQSGDIIRIEAEHFQLPAEVQMDTRT